MNAPDKLAVSEIAALFGVPESSVRQRIAQRTMNQDFYSIAELAHRWRCSRGTVYNRLRKSGAKVLDFAEPGKRGKKVTPASTVFEIESRQTKRLC
jgi:predicted DNA-binding protein YlxM (UPF0122 family)